MEKESNTHLQANGADDSEPIRLRAYELWLKEGMPKGCELKHWLEAELECCAHSAPSGQEEERSKVREQKLRRRNSQH